MADENDVETLTRVTADLTIALGDDEDHDIVVRTVRGQERLNEAFRYEVVFWARGIAPGLARGAGAELALGEALGHGLKIAGSVETLGAALWPVSRHDDRVPYRAVLVPSVYLALSRRRGFRIFQDLSVVDIAKLLCKESGLPPESFVWDGLTRTYAPRTFCVQYDESAWDFLCRLLEDEGIFFAFDHPDSGTLMVFGDHVDRTKRVPYAQLTFSYEPGWSAGDAQVWNWHETARLAASHVVLDDYDHQDPRQELRAEAQVPQTPAVLSYAYPGGYATPSDAKRIAALRLHALQRHRRAARAETNALALRPGQRFALHGHPTADPEHLVESISLLANLDDNDPTGASLGGVPPRRLRRTVVAVSAKSAYRPPRRIRRPRIRGLQTARVTGPAGSEIHCDTLGRVKLQFHWDRDGKLDDHTSCWVRVSQLHTTGSVSIPRVGWEVIVEFEGGDPDRPLCFGQVWNPFFPPPVQLPDGKTETHHASLSSPGGGGVNQITLDDAAGSESVRIAGHRNIVLLAGNNKTFNVGGDISHRVGANRKAEVVGDETIELKSDYDAHVGGGHTITLGAREVKVGGSVSEDVVGKLTIAIAAAENVQVGNPSQAVLDAVKSMALAAAKGAAAGLVHKAEQALLGPIAPVLAKAKEALGPASAKAGPAAAILGADPEAAAAMFGTSGAAVAKAGGGGDAATLSAGFAHAATGGSPPPTGSPPPPPAAASSSSSSAGGGGGGGGGGGPTAATTGGSGVYSVTVGGNVTETIGGLSALNSINGLSFAVGGDSKETVGAARVEAIKGGKNETTGKSKLETVGIYMLDIKEGFSVSAKAALGLSIAGAQKQTITGSHSLSSDGPVKVDTPKLKIEGSGTVTFTCGQCKVVLSASGIDIAGASKVTIQGDTVKINENAIG